MDGFRLSNALHLFNILWVEGGIHTPVFLHENGAEKYGFVRIFMKTPRRG
jgi:hypothetical protein